MATWIPCWRVLNEGDRVVAYEASRSAHDGVTVRRVPAGRRERYDGFWFDRYFGATPEEAIEKFLVCQAQRLARLEQDRAEIEQQRANALVLARQATPHGSGRPS